MEAVSEDCADWFKTLLQVVLLVEKGWTARGRGWAEDFWSSPSETCGWLGTRKRWGGGQVKRNNVLYVALKVE